MIAEKARVWCWAVDGSTIKPFLSFPKPQHRLKERRYMGFSVFLSKYQIPNDSNVFIHSKWLKVHQYNFRQIGQSVRAGFNSRVGPLLQTR